MLKINETSYININMNRISKTLNDGQVYGKIQYDTIYINFVCVNTPEFIKRSLTGGTQKRFVVMVMVDH